VSYSAKRKRVAREGVNTVGRQKGLTFNRREVLRGKRGNLDKAMQADEGRASSPKPEGRACLGES